VVVNPAELVSTSTKTPSPPGYCCQSVLPTGVDPLATCTVYDKAGIGWLITVINATNRTIITAPLPIIFLN
jgi:hypothetical protein